MPNLVGIGLSQVPTNSMLGGLAYQDPEHASIKDLDLKNLSQINSEIADTAADIFIYDTSKDSDGGAWRKRTQHTSWYNETLGTATRGTRREFPAVAIIVSDVSSDKVTIYDGDDPDLPMWMVISGANPRGILGWATTNITRIDVTALNGILVLGTNDSGTIFKFVEDFVEIMYSSANYNITSGRTIADRNNASAYDTVSGTAHRVFVIVTYIINDVAMTVLPNAPIDSATGLPTPTIAVATDSGVSVIKDDGTVYDVIDSNGARKCYDVSFTKDHKIMHTGDLGAGSTYAGNVFVTNILTADRSEYDNHSDLYRWYSTSQNYPRINGGNTFNTRVLDPIDVGGHHYAMADDGISLIEDGTSSSVSNTDGMVAYATTSYNTGYMVGDIKGAFLSDTDDTNLSTTDLSLITNGDFSNGATGWSSDQILTVSGGGVASVQRNAGPTGQCYQTITTEVGRTYTVSVLVSAISNGFQVYKDESSAEMSQSAVNSTGTHYWTFTATSTSTRLDFSAVQSGTATASFDNITIFDGVADRSVNSKGLAVYGTVTKSAVATGAELVAYSGWSSSNYLQQPYNSDLDFGTGDLSISFWYKMTSTASPECILHRGDGGSGTWGSGNIIQIEMDGIDLEFQIAGPSFSPLTQVQVPVAQSATGQWQHFVGVRSSGIMSVYIDSVKYGNVASTQNATNTSAKTWIGERPNSSRPASNTSMALFRMSASAPSAEQIKKMYNDEKVLFRENAKATLYGSSDAVTALAFDDDTELLHVGTSSGRSDFQGLRRINNTTTAVTTAISAHDEFIIEQ